MFYTRPIRRSSWTQTNRRTTKDNGSAPNPQLLSFDRGGGESKAAASCAEPATCERGYRVRQASNSAPANPGLRSSHAPQDVVTVNTSPDEAQDNAPKKRAATWADPAWRSPPFAAIFADAFIEGSNLAAGHMATAMGTISKLLARINKVQFSALQQLDPSAGVERHTLLSTFDGPHYSILAEGQRLLKVRLPGCMCESGPTQD